MVIVSVRFTIYIYLCAITVFDSSNYWKIRAYVVCYIRLWKRNNLRNSSLCNILHKASGKEIILIIGYSTNAGYVYPAHIGEVGGR
jgi:uncharacterized protein with von Willebrand factor type A (vWA) domain